MNDLEYIRANLPQEEQLAQLAEEATELAQAALKYRRALDGTNPARIGSDGAYADLLGEVADVELSLLALGIPRGKDESDFICRVMAEKMIRWRQSLAAASQKQSKENTHEEKKNDQIADVTGHPAE